MNKDMSSKPKWVKLDKNSDKYILVGDKIVYIDGKSEIISDKNQVCWTVKQWCNFGGKSAVYRLLGNDARSKLLAYLSTKDASKALKCIGQLQRQIKQQQETLLKLTELFKT